MANKLWFLLVFLSDFVAGSVLGAESFTRRDFPSSPKFVFGAGTSAGQYEGAAFDDGRTPSSWDTYAHTGMTQGATGDIACDGYHKYKEDVQLMVETGLEAYRFSISWSRLIPDGRGPVNRKGLEYYNNVINELVKHGIQPHVTLNHLDFPQVLEDEYGGWISRNIIKDFTAYADVCFREFGDRVSHWTTVNEPNLVALMGYDIGAIPPQRCSPPYGLFNCSAGNSSVEPYVATHNILLSHASVARLYKEKYRARQHGFVGINLFASWPVPQTNSTEDVIAAKRYNDFFLGWFLDPLVYGDYPAVMKKNAGARLPAFTEAESRLVKGSCDFVGVNHYYVMSVKDGSSIPFMTNRQDFMGDLSVNFFGDPVGGIGDESPPTPYGLFELLEYLKRFYGRLPVYVYENGQMTRKNVTTDDPSRVEYLQSYIGSLLDAMRNGSNAVGYFCWSFLDLYEVVYGYEASYGLYHVDFDDKDLPRSPKLSGQWYANFLKGNNNTRSNSLDSVIEVGKEEEIDLEAVVSSQ